MPPSTVQGESTFKRLSRNKAFGYFIAILALGLSFFALCCFAITVYPIDARMQTPGKWVFGVDWKEFIGPDVRVLLSGGNPYLQQYAVMNDAHGLYPPWAYLLLSPLTLFTPGLGSVFIFSITYFAFAVVLWKLQYKWSLILLILLSPFIYQCAWSGNIDWLAALGFIMPAPIGLIFALIKPQVGIGIAIYWLAEAWREGKFVGVIKTFAPVAGLYVLSFLIYGFWPARLGQMPKYASAFYPATLLLGLYLLWQGLRNKKSTFAVAASPLISPYTNFYSYGLALFAIDSPLYLAVTVVLAWLIH